MALNYENFKKEIKSILDGKLDYPKNGIIAGERWFAAIKNLFKGAEDFSKDKLAKSVGESAALNLMKTAFIGSDPNLAALTIENACIVYWTLATFQLLIPAPGMAKESASVVTVPGTPASLAGPLAAIFLVPSPDTSAKAKQITDAFKAYAKTVMVVITGISPPPPVTIVSPPTPIV